MTQPSTRSILILSQSYWPEQIGSAPYITELAEWLAARGAEVTVLAARPHYPDYRVDAAYVSGAHDDTRHNGVRILRMRTPTRLGSGAAGRIFLESSLLAQALIRLGTGSIRRQDRVISLCPSILLVLAGWPATRRRGKHVPIIHDIQSGLADGLGMIHSGLLKQLMVFAERTILNRTSSIAVLTDAMRRTLRRQGVRRPIDIVPIWVDTESIRPLPRPPSARPVVLYAGNLGRKQGLDQVIGAAGVLAEEAPEIRVVIRGRGARREALEARTAELGLRNVEFLDLVPREQFNECLADADVHLVPQAPDGAEFAVPSKAYGIMAAGRPFVATAAPETSLARLGEETGAFHCVLPNEERQLAGAIIRLVRSPDECRRLGQIGRRYVVDHLSRDAVLTRFAELLDFRPDEASSVTPDGGG